MGSSIPTLARRASAALNAQEESLAPYLCPLLCATPGAASSFGRSVASGVAAGQD